MITIALHEKNVIQLFENASEEVISTHLEKILWFDVVAPTDSEILYLEKILKTNLKTLDSSLFQSPKIKGFNITLLADTQDFTAFAFSCSIILLSHSFITLRFDKGRSILDLLKADKLGEYLGLLKTEKEKTKKAELFLLYAIHKTIEQQVPEINLLAKELENISYQIFQFHPGKKLSSPKAAQPDLKQIIHQIGRYNDFLSKTEDCFTSLNLLLETLPLKAKLSLQHKEKITHLKNEIETLLDYISSLNDKISFLLGAATSLVGIRQSTFAQTLSILAAIFAPPAIITGFLGMNFSPSWHLGWEKGVIFSLSAMTISGFLPYLYFKYKKRI